MKKYIIFFISIGLLLIASLVYFTVNIEESKKIAFSESGYILSGSNERHYFVQDETYSSTYNNSITFNDTEGEKVTVKNDSFIHYSSGNIMALQSGVLLDLNNIDSNPILYYNVGQNKEIRKASNRYVVKNLEKEISFEYAIWKISANKYIVLGNNIKIELGSGTTQNIDGYVEFEYFDNEIINIYNQEINYQTISSNSYLTLGDGIIINLGTKIVSKNGENKMSLEDMVIDSEDNVTLIDLTQNDEEEKDGNVDIYQNGESSNNTNTENQNTVIGEGGQDNSIEIDTPDIEYDDTDDNETTIDVAEALNEPSFKFEDMEITAIGVKGNIKITDDDDLLSKDEDVSVKIINNSTGKVVYTLNEIPGVLNIPLDIQTLLPNTQYTIIVTASYILDETVYSKNFINKTFTTSKINIDINKNGFTDSTLNFEVKFNDSNISGANITLLDANGEELLNRERTLRNVNNQAEQVSFTDLESNTDYKLKISKIQYNGATQMSDDWVIYYNDCKTLKARASIEAVNYSIDKKNGTFKLFIEDIKDKDTSIQNYTYVVYKYVPSIGDDGKTVLTYDTQNVIYTRDTTDNEITINVGNDEEKDPIIRNTYYGFKVIANSYDNEKIVESESYICGPFILSGKTFPTLNFEKKEITPISIEGTIYLTDNDNTLVVDEQNALTVSYRNNLGDEGTVLTIIDKSSISIIEGKNKEQIYAIPIKLEGLRAETSYVISLSGTVDLDDSNPVVRGIIGNVVVTTASYTPIEVKYSVDTDKLDTAFSLDVNLQSDDFAEKHLDSITFVMQGGSNFNPDDDYWTLTINNSNYAIYANGNNNITSLSDLVCKNTLSLTPSMIGGGIEADYKEINYVVLTTVSVDGTSYRNEIPVWCEFNESLDKGTYEEKYIDKTDNRPFSAAYIIMKGKGTIPTPPDDDESKFSLQEVLNKNSTNYDIEKNPDLNDETVVGYYVRALFENTGTNKPKTITYYVWDSNGNPVYGKDGKQLTKTIPFEKDNKVPSCVFELDSGTTATMLEDNKTGMHRGDSYYFTYTVEFEDENGEVFEWPHYVDPSMDNTSLKSSVVSPNKQEPIFVMYPKNSDETTMTYIYSCHDYDKALEYNKNGNTNMLLFVDASKNQEHEIDVDVFNEEVTFDKLTKDVTYIAKYKCSLNKVTSPEYIERNLVKQKFEGIEDMEDITYNIESYDVEKSPNKVTVTLDGLPSKCAKIANVQVDLTIGGKSKISLPLRRLLYNNDTNKYYIEIDVAEIAKENDIIGKEIACDITLYYDTGMIGYIPLEKSEYAAYVNTSNNSYPYMTINDKQEFIEDRVNGISGNMYKYNFTANEGNSAKLTLNSSNIYELLYTQEGLKYKDSVIVQKIIGKKQIAATIPTDNKFTITNIIPSIRVHNIDTTLTTASIDAEILKPQDMQIDAIYAEICLADDQNLPDWDNAEVKEVDINNLKLEGLKSASSYWIRFKCHIASTPKNEYVYMYDMDTGIVKREYSFDTLNNIGINQMEVVYKPTSYHDKSLNISFNINEKRSTMFEKIIYEFWKCDDEGNATQMVQLTDDNIINTSSSNKYSIVNGKLQVINSKFESKTESFDSISERINISPKINKFDFGNKYILKVIPMVNEITIEEYQYQFYLKDLESPPVGIKITRDLEEENKKITARISINDLDYVVLGEDNNNRGTYKIEVKRYKANNGDKESVNFYNNKGEDITNNTFNLLEHATNYSVIIKDADFSYTYELNIIINVDTQNHGNSHQEIITRKIEAINNDTGIVVGSTVVEKNDNKVDINFYDSYNLQDINYISYSLYSNDNNLVTSGSFEPDEESWEQVIENELTNYYKLTLPIIFRNNETSYIIALKFYKRSETGKLLVDSREIIYIYKKD